MNLLLIPALSLCVACGTSVTPAKLYGKWNYTRIQSLNWNPDSTTTREIEMQKPYVQFNENNSLVMVWGGDTILKGTFKPSGDKILVTQRLTGGKTRDFYFKIFKLAGNELIFDSTDRDPSRVYTRK
ncbi:hypothetical protein [Hufsiella ginkgonis]|uniref:Lipocalin-like domain-containing protein n=1 Tax=Hufsiella ginkgonis TaxID=2695274 RepID=A0A7K1Y1M3_9SPHI|nr:hypothetical protein [Hufsiella ginkgonis]MXV17145.1 hypothetical protein [Hufsiella ginkgonis]